VSKLIKAIQQKVILFIVKIVGSYVKLVKIVKIS